MGFQHPWIVSDLYRIRNRLGAMGATKAGELLLNLLI
jgi:hypothetical protein